MSSLAPEWLIATVRQAKRGYSVEKRNYTRSLLSNLHLPTVCESAQCPNRGVCFSDHTATFLILGEICTRGCAFCAVKRGQPAEPPVQDEPERITQAVIGLGLSHVVITSVTRDDIFDGGATHYTKVVRALRECCPQVTVELLVPDFGGSGEALATVLATRPEILAHNLETIPRLYSQVRQGADYHRSLTLLAKTKKVSPEVITKSGLMLGLGEDDPEVEAVLRDLRGACCDMLTIGQYLAPSTAHAPVERYVTPEEFDHWRETALHMGFKSVASGPLVRSSYRAPVFYKDVQ